MVLEARSTQTCGATVAIARNVGTMDGSFSVVSTHRPLSSSFLGLPYRILNLNHKKELLRGLWVIGQPLQPLRAHIFHPLLIKSQASTLNDSGRSGPRSREPELPQALS